MADLRPGRGLWRGVSRIAAAVLASFIACSAQAATDLTGGYKGSGHAFGMSMVLSQSGDQLLGRLSDGEHNVYDLDGRLMGDAVQGRMFNASTAAAFELRRTSNQIEFALIPIAQDGRPNTAAGKIYVFVSGEVKDAALAHFSTAPPKRDESADIMQFLQSYPSWSPKDVAIAYGSLSDHDRAIINGFDHLQADLMNRLCRGKAARASTMSISEREDLSCVDVVALFDMARVQGHIEAFGRRADDQRQTAHSVFACAKNLFPATRCSNIGNAAARSEKSWRGVGAILKETASFGFKSGAVADDLLPDPRSARPAHAVEPTIMAPETVEEKIGQAPAIAAAEPPKANVTTRSAKSGPVPMPRERPLLVTHLGKSGVVATSLDDFVLANADQSSSVKSRPQKKLLRESAVIELRPGLGQDAETIGERRTGKDAQRSGSIAIGSDEGVPPPRKKPATGG